MCVSFSNPWILGFLITAVFLLLLPIFAAWHVLFVITGALGWTLGILLLRDAYSTDFLEDLEQHVNLSHIPYDPTDVSCLENFVETRRASLCPYAPPQRSPRIKLWGSHPKGVRGSLEAFDYFARNSREKEIDGFLFEDDTVDGSFEQHSRAISRILAVLESHDPQKAGTKATSRPDRPWQFTWRGHSIFLASFSSCYPAEHPRHARGTTSTFLLCQPAESFSRHSVTPEVRQRIHQAFERGNSRVFYATLKTGVIAVPPVTPGEKLPG